MSLNNAELMNTLSCTLGNAGYPCGENPINIVSLSLATAGLALLMVFWLVKKLKSYPRGTPEMNKLSEQIQSGARAFLVT